MGFRKGAYFYDQFLLSPSLSTTINHNGELLKGCGMIAFGIYDSYMNKVIEKQESNRTYGLKKYFAKSDLEPYPETYEYSINNIHTQSQDSATYSISDHRPIWMNLTIW